jgi:hypothetical protein
VVVAGEATAQPAPSTPPGIAQVPSISDLASVDPSLNCVDVIGYAHPLDGGGGVFVWRAGRAAKLDAGVRIASRTPDKGHWVRATYDGASVRPEWFGSLSTIDDHSILIQRAIDFVVAEGGGRIDLGSRTYRCLSRIRVDPVRSILSGAGAMLDFSNRPEPESASLPPVVDLTTLRSAASGAWSASADGLNHRLARPTDLSVPLHLKEGQRYRVSCKISLLQGDPSIPFLRLQIFGDGARPIASYVTSAPDHIVLDFEWPAAVSGRLALSSNSDVSITGFELRLLGTPECLLVEATEETPRYGHKWLEGFRVYGPAQKRAATKLHGIRFETRQPAKASRAIVRSVTVDGFDTAVVLSHRAYLIQFFGARLVSRVSVHFLHGAEDAGENISFFGCTLGGGQIGIWNGGAEINMFGTSIDFAEQMYCGSGILGAHGCHFETHRTTRSDQYLFDLSEGQVAIDGGYLMVSGHDFATGNSADYIVYTRSQYARFMISNVYCYNLRTKTDILAGGPGRFHSRNLLGGATKHVAALPKRDDRHNIFGPASALSAAAVGIDFSLFGGERSGRFQAANGAISLLPNEAGEPGRLALTKQAEAGAQLELWLLAPCHPAAQVGWSVDAALKGGPGKRNVSIGIMFLQMVGRDEHNGPVIGSVTPAKSSERVDIAAEDGWLVLRGSTMNTRYADPTDGTAPSFTTHMAIRIDAKNLERGDELLIHSPYAGLL